MFKKVIFKSVPLSGVCRLYGKNICKLQNILQTNVKTLSVHKRHINTSCLLLSNKPITQEKLKNEDNEKFKEKDVKDLGKMPDYKDLENAIEESKKVAKEKKDLPEKTDLQSEQEQEKKKDKQWRAYGRQVILASFAKAKNKDRDTYLECLRMYTNSPGKKVDRVLFIYTALRHMKDFGVEADLELYKAILDIFPKETMVPTNIFQTMFMHYPKEQYCGVAILEQMEDNLVIPDPEMELMLLNIFGSHGLPTQKYWKMMYWMPKFRNKNPWPVPRPIPTDPYELAKLAMHKISSIDVQSTISIYNTEDVDDSIDKTWIVSAMAPKQSELLQKHDKSKAIFVEGPFKEYITTQCVDYFMLRADPSPNRRFPDIDSDAVDKIKNPYLEYAMPKDVVVAPCVHEEVDATIFALCATGTSTKDSLLSWVRCLQKTNPVLGEIPVVFTLKKSTQEAYYLEEGEKAKEENSPSD